MCRGWWCCICFQKTENNKTLLSILPYINRSWLPRSPNKIPVISYLQKFQHSILLVNILWIASLLTSRVAIIIAIHPPLLTGWYPPRPRALHFSHHCCRCDTAGSIADRNITRRIRAGLSTTDWSARIRQAVSPCKKKTSFTRVNFGQIHY